MRRLTLVVLSVVVLACDAFCPSKTAQRSSQRRAADDDDLTVKFYQELQRRSELKEKKQVERKKGGVDEEEEEEAFERVEPATLKFTGRDASLLDASPQNSNNFQRERQHEFQLAGIFEQTLPLQAAAVTAALAFMLYVGWSGGISSDNNFVDDEYDDTSIEYLKQIRTDDSTNSDGVWL